MPVVDHAPAQPGPTLDALAQRDVSVDIVRGVAILTMFAANLGGILLAAEHPLWFRFYGSFAAPIFITLSGMMVARANLSKNRSSGYYARRAAIIILIAALLDLLLWRICPFTSCDVLYLIGLAMPLTALFLRLRWPLAQVAIFLLTPPLQQGLGYRPEPMEYQPFKQPKPPKQDLPAQTTAAPAPAEKATAVWRSYVIDGWFPIFPWLAFALLGAFYGARRHLPHWHNPPTAAAVGAIFLALGVIGYVHSRTVLLIREGYCELFYPPTLWYIALAIGIMCIALAVADASNRLLIYRPLAWLGKTALLMYILHQVIGQWVLLPILGRMSVSPFLIVYAAMFIPLSAIAYAAEQFKKMHRIRWMPARVILGG